MANLGHIEGVPTRISTYLERVELILTANKVDDRMVAVLLSLVGGKTYDTLKNLHGSSRYSPVKII